jgi:benzoate-CoA ligase family protein
MQASSSGMRKTFPEIFNLANYYLFDRLREPESKDFATKAAILYGERRYSYEFVADRTERFASLLMNADVRRGERVLIILPDTPPFVWAFFGTLLRGSVVAMGNPDVSFEQLAGLLRYTRATAVVTVPKVAEPLAKLFAEQPVQYEEVRRVWVVADVPTGGDPEAGVAGPSAVPARAAPRFGALAQELASVTRAARFPIVHRDEPAIWLFTSGSTGEPKANVHAHRDFAYNTEVYAKGTVGYRASDVTVSVSRLYFGYATGTNLMFPFAVGATTGLFSERPTPETLASAIAMYKPTIVTNVPTMLGKLLEHDAALRSKGGAGLDLSSIRFSLSAGEALPEPLLRRWLDRFGSDVYDGIGSAEMFHIYASNRPGDVVPGSLGRPVAGYELRVLPEDAVGPGTTPCAPGEIGVLWVRGDSASMGYWLDRDKSFRTFFGEWCRTGDLFRLDEKGYLYFAGRTDDLIKVSGLWVAPLEVEECMLLHAAVAQVAVVGVEHEGLTKPKAFVVLRESASRAGAALEALAEELKEHVKARLSKHKYPRLIEFVADLPKNDRGKVDKKALRAGEKAS